VFEQQCKCRILLNHKKSIFKIHEGKLLEHIVSKDGVKVDRERIEAIKKILLPKHKKALHSFFGKINFIRIFIPNFVEITKPISRLLKKYIDFKWNDEGKQDFEIIK
jgi:hypothetical protein